MKPHPDLEKFLSSYDENVQALFWFLRELLLSVDPDVNELIWDNYNALALAYSKSEVLKDAYCHIALYSKHVNLGFNRGAELRSPAVKLEGKGKLIRHIKVKNTSGFPENAIKSLISSAIANSIDRNPALDSFDSRGISKVMSVSPNKRR